MIVTCPTCSSKYRVRDEAVPPEGAELQCPSCNAVFLAHPPIKEANGAAVALEKMTRARDAAELRVLELEKELALVKTATDELVHVAEGKDVDIARAEARAAAAEASVRRLTDEVARSRAAGDAAELLSVKTQLFEAQRRQKQVSADLEVANTLIASLQADVTVLRAVGRGSAAQADSAKQIAALQSELESLRAQLTREVPASSSGAPSSATMSMIAAIGPMLWGLDNSISYLEQFAGSEATLAGHVRQLRLLQKVLQRLAETT